MIPRSEWTDRPPTRYTDWGDVVGVVVHYAGVPGSLRGKDWRSIMRGVQAGDMDRKGYSDIMYNLGVPLGTGDFVVLRGLENRGAANGDMTSNAREPSILIIAGVDDVLDDQDDLAVQRAISYVRDKWPRAKGVRGHREVKATACPGDRAFGRLKAGMFEPKEIPVTPAIPPFNPAVGQWSLWPLGAKPMLGGGSTGDVVRYLQGVLALRAAQPVTISGTYDEATIKAVYRIQLIANIKGFPGVTDGQVWTVIDRLATTPG